MELLPCKPEWVISALKKPLLPYSIMFSKQINYFGFLLDFIRQVMINEELYKTKNADLIRKIPSMTFSLQFYQQLVLGKKHKWTTANLVCYPTFCLPQNLAGRKNNGLNFRGIEGSANWNLWVLVSIKRRKKIAGNNMKWNLQQKQFSLFVQKKAINRTPAASLFSARLEPQ